MFDFVHVVTETRINKGRRLISHKSEIWHGVCFYIITVRCEVRREEKTERTKEVGG